MSVRCALLALLIPGPSYGYELRNQLERVTGSLRSTNIGQVYSTLSRLERDGLVLRTMSAHPVGSAREQVRYALTDSGRAAAHVWFGQPQAAVVPVIQNPSGLVISTSPLKLKNFVRVVASCDTSWTS